MYTLKPFEKNEQDYETIVLIHNAHRPEETITVELAKYDDQSRPDKFPFQRDFVLSDGEIIGFGAYRQNETSHKANKYIFGFVAHPEHKDQQGAFQFYLDHVLNQLADKNLTALVSGTREDRPEKIKFLEANAFKCLMRYPISHLDVETFDLSTYDAQVKRTADSGIEIITVSDLQKEHPDNWKQIFYDLDNEVSKDVPSPDEYIPDPLDVFSKGVFEHPAFIAEANFLAREGDKYVGMSNLWKDMTNESRLWTGLTGVVRSHRRRGVATALKIHAIKFAKAYGAKVIKTDNEENNPMYDLNMQLGFTPKPAYLDYEKSLK